MDKRRSRPDPIGPGFVTSGVAMPLRPCLDCGALSQGARCPGHTRVKQRGYDQAKRAIRPYTSAERKRRAEAVAQHRQQFGDVCPGYMRDPHPSTDLTADHPHAVARGGAEDQPLTVLCRSCNSSKKDSYTG